MIKSNQKHFNRLHVVMDAIIIVVAYMAAWAIRFVSPFNNDEVGRIDLKTYLMALIFVVPAYLILYAVFSLYTPKRMHGQRYEMFNVIKANTIGLLMFILVLYLTRQIHFSRIMLVIFYGLNITFEFMARVGLRMLLRNIRKRGFNQKHIVLVGYSRAAEGYIDRIKQFPQWGYNVVGILDDHVDIDTKYRGEKVVGRVGEIEQIISENDLDEIVITLGLADYAKLEKEIADFCEKPTVKVFTSTSG